MDKRDLTIVDYWSILSRQKYLLLMVTVLVATATAGFIVLVEPPVTYQAITKVKLERPISAQDYLAQAFSDPYVDAIASQVTMVRSFPVLERVAQELALLPRTATPEQRQAEAYLRTIYDLQQQVRAEQEDATTIIKITAMAKTGEAAAHLANTVAQAYQAYSTALRAKRIEEVRRFADMQLTTIEGNLAGAEEALRAFREQKGHVFLTEEAKSHLTRLTDLEAKYDKVHLARLDAMKQIRFLEQDHTLFDVEQATGFYERIFTVDQTQILFQQNLALIALLRERETLLIDRTPQHPQVQTLTVQIRNLQQEMVGELAAKIEYFRNQEDILQTQLAQKRAASQRFPLAAIQLSRLEREVQVNAELYAKLRAKHEEMLMANAQQIEEIIILDPAPIPQQPTKAIAPGLKGGISVLMGLFFGLIAAFLRESFTSPMGKPQEIEQQLAVPILGVVPAFNEKALKAAARQQLGIGESEERIEIFSKLFCLLDPQSKLAETIRTIRSNLQFACRDREVKTILMTNLGLANGRVSTSSGSATLVNLALLLAEDGKRVLLVDANIRNPVIHESVGLARAPGLTEALAEGVDWREYVRTATDLMMGPLGIERVLHTPELDLFDVLTAGGPSGNPSKLLQSERLGELIGRMRATYDYVLVDAAPILSVADSLVLGAKVDGVVLLCQDTRTSQAVWQRTKGVLAHARAVLLGVVLTNAKAEALRDYAGDYAGANLSSQG
jgi:capsular exopolysaccharide synthesis family protein